MILRATLFTACIVAFLPAAAAAQQNPSPMVELSRAHGRIQPGELAGARDTFAGPTGKPVFVFVPERSARARTIDLLVHFHGAAFLPEHAVAHAKRNYGVATVQLGGGSGIYDSSFSDPRAFTTLLDSIRSAMGSKPIRKIVLSGFSAGHGAVRAILRDSAHFAAVDAVLLLDGMHTSYEPAGTVVALGGRLDTTKLVELVRFAQEAAHGRKRMLITHSEIFPGTFASTTETANYLLETVQLLRAPVLKWGPVGMQQTSQARRHRLLLLGFAGNSAPDHVDHFHGMPQFLAMLDGL